MNNKVITKSGEETKKLARKIAKSLNCNLLCLYGDLGSGKTTFTQGLAEYFGIKRLVSPTFVIMRRYSINITNEQLTISNDQRPMTNDQYLYHIDLYRLENINEIKAIGIEEIIADKNSIVVIEWAERMKEMLPKERVDICFKYKGDNEREITVFEQGRIKSNSVTQ